MWGPIVGLLVASTEAYAPLRWTPKIQSKQNPKMEYTIVSKDVSGHSASLIPPLPLSVGNVPDNDPSTIPHFSARPDGTIVWDEMKWCLEASGDVALVNSCSGSPSQKWTWIPDGHGRNIIQLSDSSRCLDVVDSERGVVGAPVEIRQCAYEKMESWRLEELVPSPTQRLAPSLSVLYAMISFTAVGALGLSAWRWHLHKKVRAVVMNQGTCANQGSLSLSAPSDNMQATSWSSPQVLRGIVRPGTQSRHPDSTMVFESKQPVSDCDLQRSLTRRISILFPKGQPLSLGPDDVTADKLGPDDVVKLIFNAFKENSDGGIGLAESCRMLHSFSASVPDGPICDYLGQLQPGAFSSVAALQDYLRNDPQYRTLLTMSEWRAMGAAESINYSRSMQQKLLVRRDAGNWETAYCNLNLTDTPRGKRWFVTSIYKGEFGDGGFRGPSIIIPQDSPVPSMA